MTCATCRGTKVKKTLVAALPRVERQGGGTMPVYEESPCPDCTPRPFAWVDHEDGRSVLVIGGQRTEEAFNDGRGELVDVARAINADIEEREAKLRGALSEAASALADVVNVASHVGPVSSESAAWHHATDVLRLVVDALAGRGPDYVQLETANALVIMLGAVQAKHMGTWGVLRDQLEEQRGAFNSPTTVALLEDLGLPAKGGKIIGLIADLRAALRDGINAIAAGASGNKSMLKPMEYAFERAGDFLSGRQVALSQRMDSLTDDQLLAEFMRRRLNERPPIQSQPQWRDSLGRWHDFVGGVAPIEARELRVIHRVNAAAEPNNNELLELLGRTPDGPLTATEVVMREEERRAQELITRMVQRAFVWANLEPTEERMNYVRGIVATRERPPATVEYLGRALLAREEAPQPPRSR